MRVSAAPVSRISTRLLVLLGLLFLHGRTIPLVAQTYLWPTNASKYLTSTFCEFRPRHYHAAIDIKTWNRTGYKVYAIEDGYVFRIRVSSFGYGKALYLKLKDGNIVVYAHLQRFIPALERFAEKMRIARRSYRLDVFPGPEKFPVKRGQIIGYTGETGIGVPHLHFEIRDSKNQPVNPLQFYQRRLKDHIAPTISSIAIIPLKANSLVNLAPDTLLLHTGSARSGFADSPIYLSGAAYLAVKASDRADGVSNRFGIYGTRLFVNDSLIYQVNYDRFNYAQTALLEVDKNFSLWRKGKGIYQNLYIHPENKLPFYGKLPSGSGLLSGRVLSEGKNQVRVEVYDYAGNTTTVNLSLLYHHPSLLQYYGKSFVDNHLYVALESDFPLKRITGEFVYNPSGLTESITQYQVLGGKQIMGQFHYYLFFPLPAKAIVSGLRLTPFSEADAPTLPIYIPLKSAPDNRDDPLQTPNFRLVLKGENVGVRFDGTPIEKPPPERPAAMFYPYQANKYYWTFPLEWGLSDDFPNARVQNELRAWTPLYPNRETTIHSTDGVLAVRFFANTLYDTVFSKISVLPADSRMFPQDKAQFLSPVYDVQPFDQPLKGAAFLYFSVPDTLSDVFGLGLYYWDRKKGWLFLPAGYDSLTRKFSAPVTSLEKFTLFRDTTPPQITPLFQLSEQNVSVAGKPLKFVVKDELSGIQKESQITVLVDNQWTLFEYDPEEDWVIINPAHLPPGRHQLQISATDNVGNRRQVSLNISS